MTKTLTEQWKDGELQFGKTYWCSDDEGNVAKLVLVSNDRFYEWTLGTEVTKDVKEVLAPVPNYDEYNELIKKIEQLEEANNLFLKIQNKLEDEQEEETMTETRIYELIDDYLTKWVGKDWWMKNDKDTNR